jgi:predicted kinase/ribosomal protein S13
MNETPRVPRKKGQHRGSSSHSDLYTDENPKGTIKGLKFATVKDAKSSVSKIKGSGKSHAHKIQAAVAMEQRAKEMGKSSQAAVYRSYINKMKKKTKENKDYTFGPDWIPTSLAQRKKMKRIHGKLNRSIREDVNIPVKIGDTILTGRFKNKKTVVKSIGKDEHGMPTINGRKVVTFRLPLKEASQASGRQGPKGYTAFVELGFEKEYYKHMENILTKNGETMILKEGINDPGILKAVFLAGGPGSGKTWVAKGLFGIPERVNVSQTGMKMVNTDKELKFLLKKYGFGTNLDALPDEVFDNLTGDGPDASGLRSYAKELTGVRKKLYQNGRLGMIIDGTGDDYAKISKEKKELEEKGYDCYMVFVNTTLEVALKRNKNRDRVLPEKIVVDSHREVIKNIGGFQGLFGGNNFIIIDNNKDLSPKQAQKRFNMLVKKGISKFIKRPIKNPRGKSWVRKQKMLETYTLKDGTTLLLERIDFQQIAKKIMNKYRVNSKLEFSPRATKGDYDFDRDIIKLRPFYKSVQDFMITLLHEIYHAMDSKKYGRKKFVRMYTQAGQEQEDKGKDFHDNNPFEIAAERWARREWRGKWKHSLRKK